MLPFGVDPSWYEEYWYGEPSSPKPRRTTVLPFAVDPSWYEKYWYAKPPKRRRSLRLAVVGAICIALIALTALFTGHGADQPRARHAEGPAQASVSYAVPHRVER